MEVRARSATLQGLVVVEGTLLADEHIHLVLARFTRPRTACTLWILWFTRMGGTETRCVLPMVLLTTDVAAWLWVPCRRLVAVRTPLSWDMVALKTLALCRWFALYWYEYACNQH